MTSSELYTPTLRDKIHRLIHEMGSEKFSILEKVRPENREEFIETVKEFIRYDYGKPHGFDIEFTNDYSHIYKITRL